MPDKRQPEDIRERMNALRGSLDHNVEQVATGVRARTDWRYYVRNHPWLTVAAATAAGYWLVPRKTVVQEKYVPSAQDFEQLVKNDKIELKPKKAEASLSNKLVAMAAAAASHAALKYATGKLDGIVTKVAQSHGDQRQSTQAQQGSVYPK